MRMLVSTLRELTRFKTAVFGLFLLAIVVSVAIYAVVTIPYGEAIKLWRGGEEMWRYNPVNARPAWLDFLTPKDLPETIILRSEEDATKTEEALGETARRIFITYTFEYKPDLPPSEIALVFKPRFEEKGPLVTATWTTPDGREYKLGRTIIRSLPASGLVWYSVSLDKGLNKIFGAQNVEEGLFTDPDTGEILRGEHKVVVQGILFEPGATFEAELVLYGTVHGIAGTDHRRRDLTVALLWGAPVALSFGLAAAFGIAITSLIAAAVGAWFGGWVDSFIQRLTEIRMVIPTLPIIIMVGMFYSKSIWVILATILVLNIIESSVKSWRALFLQTKHLPYIEAARSYGAGHTRIILRYLIPKVIPMLIPSFILAVPSYVFFEAALAFIGLGDPVLPTWGKILHDAQIQGALYRGYYYWVLEPAFMLMLTGFGFSMLGHALDRIFNPRLREI